MRPRMREFNPWFDVALGVELTPRERKHLMSQEDWDEVVTIKLREENRAEDHCQ